MASTSCFKNNSSLDDDEEPGRPCFFTYKELKKATGNFKEKLGDGGYGTVYKGKLPDGQTVAVKKLFEVNPSFKRFFNGVDVLYRYRHQNLVTFYGCTNPLDTMLLLVYEFVFIDTLSYYLHCQTRVLIWNTRIQIALETAEALVYLHSLQPQVIHTQFKSGNILLDDDMHVKLAGLGEHGILPSDAIRVNGQSGPIGYQDPEYNRTLRQTDKSNVYSFGVVLLELISGMPAIDKYRDGDDVFLVSMALRKIRNNTLDELVDQSLGYHYDRHVTRMIDSVAEVACNCFQQVASNRPSMVEVLKFLKGIQDETNM